jgi:hypothetical protein
VYVLDVRDGGSSWVEKSVREPGKGVDEEHGRARRQSPSR